MNLSQPLAILGMGAFLPKSCNINEFWRLLIDNKSAITTVPDAVLDRELYFQEAKGVRGKTYMNQGGLVDYPAYDQLACRYPTNLMNYIEVGHLMMVQVAAEACRQANFDPFAFPYKNTGVYVGNNQAGLLAGKLSYSSIVEEAAQYLKEIEAFRNVCGERSQKIINEVVEDVRKQLPKYGHDGFPTVGYHVTANAVTDALGLNGPSLVLDAACSSSLKALSLAAQDLQLGKIDAAIVGGASFFTADSLLLFSAAQSGSAKGCFPFSEKADGLISAEGYVSIIVKPLDRALADGDPIQAVVTGIGVSSDGRGKSLWAPRKEGQVEAIRRAYRDEKDMARLDFVEAHATSTALGDQTELEAMEEAFRGCFETKIPVGGVKANIGHALEAAGLTGLIKSVLVLQNKIVPKQINSQPLNSRIDWETLPFFVPQENTPLAGRRDGLPLRAAVNSFGIGGLNVHVVLEEFEKRQAVNSSTPIPGKDVSKPHEPIAVVGVGALFPGARTAKVFEEIVFSDEDPSGDVDRWNSEVAYDPDQAGPWRSPGRRGASLRDFQYDWKRHRIPPKHLSTGDPLQFMILDSVDAAMIDAGYTPVEVDMKKNGGAESLKSFPSQRTGVIVGSTFDTDFATELCMGFRIPHFQRELRKVLHRHGIDDETQIQDICKQYADALIKHMPAITDETGSFTPSTLSSRITKTYDLMGGAATIDSGNTVALAALDQAVNSLRAGTCDVMICSVGARMMGLQTFARMGLAGQLARDGKHNVLDAEAEGQIPGEGAGTLILKRLSDAVRDGDKVHFLIHGIGVGFNADPSVAFNEAMDRAWQETAKCSEGAKEDVYLIEGSAAPAEVVDKELDATARFYTPESRSSDLYFDRADARFGHSLGASGMASLLKAKVELQDLKMPKAFQVDTPRTGERQLRITLNETPIRPITSAENVSPRVLAAVSSWDPCGSAYHAVLERGARVASELAVSAPKKTTQTVPADSVWKVVRFESETQNGLMALVAAALQSPESVFQNATETTFRSDQAFRLAVVAADAKSLAEKLALAKKFAFGSHDNILAQKGVFVSSDGGKKVAMLFSGQGSQYAGMLKSLVDSFGPARSALKKIDADLAELGMPSFADLAWNDAGELGKDVFRTQLSLLCADTILCRCLAALGVSPSVVAGHSFGEFPALVASGAWTFREGARATKVRCDSICNCKNALGVMLSTNWDAEKAEAACRHIGNGVYVANINAPDQTILGGTAVAVAEVERYIKSSGGAAKTIPVPRPFHTKLMEEVRQPLFDALDIIDTKTPTLDFFSSVTNVYVRDAAEIRRNLADQMTRPVRYIDLIHRLQDDGVGIFIECGPNQVLTGIHRKILTGDTAITLPTDSKQGDGLYPLLCVKACVEVFAARSGEPVSTETDWGTRYRNDIVRRSQELADSGGVAAASVQWTENEKRSVEEIAIGAGLLPATVRALVRSAGGLNAFKNSIESDSPGETKLVPHSGSDAPKPIDEKEFLRWSLEVDGKPPVSVPGDDYSRFTMRVMKKPLAASQRKPVVWNGGALILGDNPVGQALAEQIRNAGGRAVVLTAEGNRDEIAARVETLWKDGPLTHLFLVTAHDPDAVTELDEEAWRRRRDQGVYLPFFVTKKWFQLLLQDNLTAKATLFGSTILGGDFGFRGALRGVEGGAISGLVKSMDLEVGFPTGFAFVAKTIDFSGEQSPEFRAKSILDELGAQIPYETEIGYIDEDRHLVRPIIQAADTTKADPTSLPQGNWVVTGGGRGITALLAARLAQRYGLRLHLLGSSPAPQVDPIWHTLDDAGKETYKKDLQAKARQSGENFADLWKRFERAVELDGSIREMRNAGIDVQYRPCDVSDRDAVRKTLNTIRKEAGPIHGVLHGAGVEVSCGMERKDPAVVEKTFAVKVDGAAALMELTKNDPLRHFIGFGSIAGRMGSIGQTDYSMANDALAKLCDWFQAARPECRTTCFHWGPWGEVGMAARPEMQNNPIMATMTLLKPEEGVRHFLNEITVSERTTETLLIDWMHYKLYYPDSNNDAAPEPEIVTETVPEIKTVVTESEPVHTPIRRMVVRWVNEEPAACKENLTFDGAVLVLGKNRDADHLAATLSGYGIDVVQAESSEDESVLLEKLDEIWQDHGPVTNLFLMTGRDPEALCIDTDAAWKRRRKIGYFSIFYLLRHWLRKLTEANLLDKAAVAAATSMNGDAGTESGTSALECSAVAGILKGLHMEQGGADRDGVTVRIVDFPVDEPSETVTSCLLYEMTTQGFDFETGYVDGIRRVPRLMEEDRPAATEPLRIEKGDVCVVTGGARGITERVARELGIRYGVKLRLIGSSDLDGVDPAMLDLSEAELKVRKRSVVKDAIANGKSAEKEWNRVRNGIESVRNIRDMRAAGIDVDYYRCDLTDPAQIGGVFSEIVRRDGPITGIVHGAGIDGNPATVRNMLDSQFDVADRLVAIKVDAVLEMLRHTDEHLRYVIGFGSISGRFGSASASSYCSGNDMLCKIMGRLRTERPNCRAVGIHWHAWGEIGMMMRPVSYGSVKILKMQLMPPEDGIGFLVRELEAGLPENEIVVTDAQYYTLFYSDKMRIDRATAVCPKVSAASTGRMLREATPKNDVVATPIVQRIDGADGICTFYPDADPFLIDHRFRGRPLLPAVIGMEAFLETVRKLYPDKNALALHDLELREGFGFPSNEPVTAKIVTEIRENRIACRLVAPFVNTKGIVVQSERIYSVGTVEMIDAGIPIKGVVPEIPPETWHPIRYVNEKSLMYHGPVFQQSVEALFTDKDGVWDRIVVRPLSEIAGRASSIRGADGWSLHPGTVDACLYICGVCVWLDTKGAIGLPKSLKTLRLGRLPHDGERVLAHVRYTHGNENEAYFDVVCQGEDGAVLFTMDDYCCQVVPTSVPQ